jgi:hypothetical protein
VKQSRVQAVRITEQLLSDELLNLTTAETSLRPAG